MALDPGETTPHPAPQADGSPLPTPREIVEAASEEPGGAKPAPASDVEVARGRAAVDESPVSKWLHSPDVSQVRSGLEHQIRAKPGRALLIALGVGYVIGRVLRGKRDT